ncbi:TPA: hypothetical protein EYP44_03115 [Candidatus Bathyarchaeota archaeon]|nr:hypothetical protein [Candidatus Bathyarchaeota archaeon]
MKKEHPKLVGVTSITPTIREALAIIRAAKEICPAAVTVMGGPHVSFLPIETLREVRATRCRVHRRGRENHSRASPGHRA